MTAAWELAVTPAFGALCLAYAKAVEDCRHDDAERLAALAGELRLFSPAAWSEAEAFMRGLDRHVH
jgi:hypothetical protein